MKPTFLTFKEIQAHYPELKPSRLDYMVREGIIECVRRGRGHPRLYPPRSLDQIKAYLNRFKIPKSDK